jgi:hypothetical protein
MTRCLRLGVLTLTLAGLVLPAAAQPAEPPLPDWVEIQVDPAAEPVPALRYRFAVPRSQQRPGDATPHYYRAFLILGQQLGADRQATARLNEWLEVPLYELPAAEARAALVQFSSALELAQIATSCAHAHWEHPVEKGVGMLMPELGQLRQLWRAVALGARLSVLEGRHDEALEYLRIGYILARHAGEGEPLIGRLVAFSIAASANPVTLEWIASPGSPNLYWALAEIEADYRDLRLLQTERELQPAWLPALFELPEQPVTLDRARAVWDDFVGAMRGNVVDEPWHTDVGPMLVAARLYPQAKQRLIDAGFDPVQVEAMPVPQVLLVDWRRDFERINDDMSKWLLLPYAQAVEGFHRSAIAVHDFGLSDHPLREMLPTIPAASRTQTMLQRRLALLRCVEAVRMHVAATGELPEDLAAIRVVPAPTDPATGESFVYRREGRTFWLEPPAAPGLRMTRGDRLKVTVRQPARDRE